MTGGKKKKKKTGDPTMTTTAAAAASPSTTSAVAKKVARRPASKQPRPMTRNDDDDDEVELLDGPAEFSRDHDRPHIGGGGADGIAVAFAATTTSASTGDRRSRRGRAAAGEVAVSANEGELLQGGATCTTQSVPAPSMAAAVAVPPALRTQLEARLLEAAYLVRPLLSMAALTSGRDGSSSSSGADCIPKKCVRNAYEFLLQDPDDADRFVESFQKSGIGGTMAHAAGAAAGMENAAIATRTTASPYGTHMDLCAAVYVNRIILTGKQAVMLLDPNPPMAMPANGTGFAKGPARATPKHRKAPPKVAPSQLPSIPQPPRNLPHSTHHGANDV